MSGERETEHDDGQEPARPPHGGAEVDRDTGEAGSAPAAQPRESGRDTTA